ncbi:MAG TPA: GNAT family N-acetyltransferase [Ruminococcaceae bacterium]|nr:GNAT family N-acetyltransferase [Oscillospiraceae bacterium]
MITAEYRELAEREIGLDLFKHFIRHQAVGDCYRKAEGRWVIVSDPFIDDWTREDYITLVKCLKNTVKTGGFVFGAFAEGKLKGFASLEKGFFGGENKYLDLSSIHVSEDLRGCGIGKRLFSMAKKRAKEMGARKLYISAHSAVESQRFYQAMGCAEAKEYNAAHTEKEPFDCQLECEL